MRFVADEGVDSQIVDKLRSEGHAVSYVAELDPGISDEAVLEWAISEGALLLTADKDFGELVFRLRRLSTGVVLLRLQGLVPEKKANAVARLVGEHSHELVQAFSVVTQTGVRIRPLRQVDPV